MGKLDRYTQKNQTGLLSHAVHKNKWIYFMDFKKLIKNLNIKPDTIKLVEENRKYTL